MLEQKSIEIDGMKFQLNPLKGFKAARLDKKVVSLLLPVFRGIEGDLDTKIDFGKALDGLSGALDGMKDDEYEKFVCDLLSTVILIPEGASPVEITKEVIDTYFQGASLTLYKLMFEVMRYNQFSPFALVGKGGSVTISTLISEKLTGSMKKKGEK